MAKIALFDIKLLLEGKKNDKYIYLKLLAQNVWEIFVDFEICNPMV